MHMKRTENTILLFGMPRSGTTWVGKAFDSHPDTKYLHEPDSRAPRLELPLFPQSAQYQDYATLVEACVEEWLNSNFVSVVGKLPLFRKSYRSGRSHALYTSLIYAAKGFSRGLGEMRLPELRKNSSSGPSAIVWKSIESLGRLPIICTQIENAKVIHIVRHPCGYVDSIIRGENRGNFSSTTKSAEDQGFFKLLVDSAVGRSRKLNMDILQNASEAERLAWRWLVMNEIAYTELRDKEFYKIISYDSVCASPSNKFKELFEFCGLSWHKQSEDFLASSNASHDTNYYSMNRDPSQAANAWRSRLADDVKAQVLAIVRGSDLWTLIEPDNPPD